MSAMTTPKPVWLTDDDAEAALGTKALYEPPQLQQQQQQQQRGQGTNGNDGTLPELDERKSRLKRIIFWASRVVTISLSILMFVTAFIGLESVSGVDQTEKIFVGVYMLFFSILLLSFEVNQLKQIESIDHMFKRNFGFLFTTTGHAFFLIFIAFLSFGLGEPKSLSYLTGICLAGVGIAKFCVFLQYPELLE